MERFQAAPALISSSEDILERELDHPRVDAGVHDLPEIRRRDVGQRRLIRNAVRVRVVELGMIQDIPVPSPIFGAGQNAAALKYPGPLICSDSENEFQRQLDHPAGFGVPTTPRHVGPLREWIPTGLWTALRRED